MQALMMQETQRVRNEPSGDTLRCAATPQFRIRRLLRACRRPAEAFIRLLWQGSEPLAVGLPRRQYSRIGTSLLPELPVLAFTGMAVHGRSTRHNSISGKAILFAVGKLSSLGSKSFLQSDDVITGLNAQPRCHSSSSKITCAYTRETRTSNEGDSI